ncbi:hypothetical protein AB0O91_07280 [Kitasatospora sp. NPDC089797]|uniref:hypothetical protein n=1 Tax=Kitasatospora sp. NPDC089797 TaxID=3155298 RepID=UPI003439AC48
MPGRRRPLAAAVLLGCALAPGTAWAADPVKPTAVPHLAIAIDDGRQQARPGDRLTWTVTLRNLGTEPVSGLRVAQDLPTAARPVSASGDAAGHPDRPSWDGLTLEPGATRTLTTTAELADTGPELLRSSSTACAYQGDSRQPLVCASHLDLLPAGLPKAAPAAGEQGVALWLALATTAAGLVTAGGWWLRRHHGQPGPAAPAGD